jgi:hypothetical protein
VSLLVGSFSVMVCGSVYVPLGSEKIGTVPEGGGGGNVDVVLKVLLFVWVIVFDPPLAPLL